MGALEPRVPQPAATGDPFSQHAPSGSAVLHADDRMGEEGAGAEEAAGGFDSGGVGFEEEHPVCVDEEEKEEEQDVAPHAALHGPVVAGLLLDNSIARASSGGDADSSTSGSDGGEASEEVGGFSGCSDSDSDSDDQGLGGVGAARAGAGSAASGAGAGTHTGARRSARANKGQHTGARFVEPAAGPSGGPPKATLPPRIVRHHPAPFGYSSDHDGEADSTEDEGGESCGTAVGRAPCRDRRPPPTVEEIGRPRFASVLWDRLVEAGLAGPAAQATVRPRVVSGQSTTSALESDWREISKPESQGAGAGAGAGAGGAGGAGGAAAEMVWPVLVDQHGTSPWFCPVDDVEGISWRLKSFAKDKLDASLGFAKAHCHWSTQPLPAGAEPGPFECHEPLCVALRRDGRCLGRRPKDTLTSLAVYAAILGCQEDIGRRTLETISDVFSNGHNKFDLEATKVRWGLAAAGGGASERIQCAVATREVGCVLCACVCVCVPHKQTQLHESYASIFGTAADPHVFTIDVSAACLPDFKGKETVDVVINDPHMLWLQMAYNAKV